MLSTTFHGTDSVTVAEDPSVDVDQKFQLLERVPGDQKSSIAWAISANTPAQDLTTGQFRVLLVSGNRGNVGAFLHWSEHKGSTGVRDILDLEKVQLILNLPDLCFPLGPRHQEPIHDSYERAMRVLGSLADLDSGTIEILVFDHKTAALALASRASLIHGNDDLAEKVLNFLDLNEHAHRTQLSGLLLITARVS